MVMLVSLVMYTLELGLYRYISPKLATRHRGYDHAFLEQIRRAFDQLSSEHLAIYSFIYFSFLLGAQWYYWIYAVIITLQLVSLGADLIFIFLIHQHDSD